MNVTPQGELNKTNKELWNTLLSKRSLFSPQCLNWVGLGTAFSQEGKVNNV